MVSSLLSTYYVPYTIFYIMYSGKVFSCLTVMMMGEDSSELLRLQNLEQTKTVGGCGRWEEMKAINVHITTELGKEPSRECRCELAWQCDDSDGKFSYHWRVLSLQMFKEQIPFLMTPNWRIQTGCTYWPWFLPYFTSLSC